MQIRCADLSFLNDLFDYMIFNPQADFIYWGFQLMVAATLILLCTKPIDVAVLGPVPWLLTVPSIAIIGREVRYMKSDSIPYISSPQSYVS